MTTKKIVQDILKRTIISQSSLIRIDQTINRETILDDLEINFILNSCIWYDENDKNTVDLYLRHKEAPQIEQPTSYPTSYPRSYPTSQPTSGPSSYNFGYGNYYKYDGTKGTEYFGGYDESTYRRALSLFEKLYEYNYFTKYEKNKYLLKDLYSELFNDKFIDRGLLQANVFMGVLDMQKYSFSAKELYDSNTSSPHIVSKISEHIGTDNSFLGSHGIILRHLTARKHSDTIISYCIFDAGITRKLQQGGGSTTNSYLGRNKDIFIYLSILRDNIESMINNSLWDRYYIHIYIDKSVNCVIADDPNKEIKKVFIDFCKYNSARIFLTEVEMPRMISSSGVGHIGLLGTLFRYIPIFIYPDVKNCFIGDSDNYNIRTTYDICTKFFTSDARLIVFRPIIYDRRNYKDTCIPNFFAGMMGFRLDEGIVVSQQLWNNMFIYIHKLYKGIRTDNNIGSSCAPLQYNSPGNHPFEFGFEEQALSNVLVISFTENSITSTIPLVWLHPPSIRDIYNDKILKKKYELFSDEFIKFIMTKLGMDILDEFNSDLFIRLISYDNNLHFIILIDNLVSEYCIARTDKIGSIPIFKDSNGINSYMNLSFISLLFSVYPGYEMNLTIGAYEETYKYLKDPNPKPSKEIIDRFKLSTTLDETTIKFLKIDPKRKLFGDKIEDLLYTKIMKSHGNSSTDLSGFLKYNDIIDAKSTATSIYIPSSNDIVYRKYNTKHLFYSELFMYLSLIPRITESVNKENGSNFEFVGFRKFDMNNMIIAVDMIDFTKYKQPSDLSVEQNLREYINVIVRAMDEYKHHSLKRRNTNKVCDNIYLKNTFDQIITILRRTNDYNDFIKDIVRYVETVCNHVIESDMYFIIGDVSIDHFINTTNGKVLFHDLNGVMFGTFEMELGIFISNVTFYTKQKIPSMLRSIKTILIDAIKRITDINGLDFKMLHASIIRGMSLKGYLIMVHKLLKAKTLDNALDIIIDCFSDKKCNGDEELLTKTSKKN